MLKVRNAEQKTTECKYVGLVLGSTRTELYSSNTGRVEGIVVVVSSWDVGRGTIGDGSRVRDN